MSSGPDSGITSGPQMSMDQFESEQKAKENEDKVTSSLSQNGNGSKVELPKDKSQLSHIFGDRPGHLPDTPGNRKKLTDLANDKKSSSEATDMGTHGMLRIIVTDPKLGCVIKTERSTKVGKTKRRVHGTTKPV